jgi:hypothetical protein
VSTVNRRRFLGTATAVTVAFVAGCTGGSGGSDGGTTTATIDGGTTAGATTTGGAIGTDEGMPTDGRPTTETTTAETAEARRTTDRTDTTSVKASDSTSDATTGNPYRQPTPMGTPTTAAGLAIVEIYPTQEQRGFISGEYVALRNTGDESLDLSGCGLTTPDRSGEPIDTYSLTLEPGATLYALIRSGDGTMLETSPPGYLWFAGFDEPVLDDEGGTIVVTDPDGDTVLEQSYGSGGAATSMVDETNGTESG